MSAVTVDLPEVAFHNCSRHRPVFASGVSDVQARVGERLVDVFLAISRADKDLNLDADEARSLAAALLAAADASEATP